MTCAWSNDVDFLWAFYGPQVLMLGIAWIMVLLLRRENKRQTENHD